MNRRDGLQRGCEIKVQHQFSIAPELWNIAFMALIGFQFDCQSLILYLRWLFAVASVDEIVCGDVLNPFDWKITVNYLLVVQSVRLCLLACRNALTFNVFFAGRDARTFSEIKWPRPRQAPNELSFTSCSISRPFLIFLPWQWVWITYIIAQRNHRDHNKRLLTFPFCNQNISNWDSISSVLQYSLKSQG